MAVVPPLSQSNGVRIAIHARMVPIVSSAGHKKGAPQFGLIAEEVAEANADVVVRVKNGEVLPCVTTP